MISVVLTGSESTGKTTLARELASAYGAELVPEFVREYALQRGNVIRYEDTDEIARGQIALEDSHALKTSGLIIKDTDLLSTVVYSRHYYGRCAEWIAAAGSERCPDLYLLLDIDVPWVPDAARDREDRREEMQSLFIDALVASGSPCAVIRGDWNERILLARAAVDGAVARYRSV